ncbi:MAG: PKD domain-containing protein [Chitinophagaceae bacterium]|nr:MAG: PKD domain-containing protein [Chitinophagaceae bacterium]
MKIFRLLGCLLFIIIFLTGISQKKLSASHIVGGDIFYECLGNNDYKVTIIIYRDCYLGLAPFDNPLYLAVYDINDSLHNTYMLPFPGATNIPPTTSDPCLQAPLDVCVEEGVYEITINLPPQPGGYYLSHQRCCRNNTIANIIDPGASGSTYTIHIPGPDLVSCNNSAYFNDFPPIVICANQPFVFDHSATDPDGDSLSYEFCEPLLGATFNFPMPAVPASLPFDPVNWLAPFNVNNPLPANPPLAIDPVTGEITGTPNQLGQYVIGVCVREYRNGVFIGKTRRDFQFNVTDCSINVEALIPVIDTSAAASLGTSGLYITQCNKFDVDFINQSINATSYFWDFGDGNTSTDFQPNHVYPDTGTYVVTLIANPGSVCSDTTDVLVEIYPFFEADFLANSVCVGESVFFEDLTVSSFNDVESWNWSFGDGEFSTNQNPVHVYDQPGTYLVILEAESEKGCYDIREMVLEIYGPPEVTLNFNSFCLGDEIVFVPDININADSITQQSWTLNGQPFFFTDSFTISFQQTGSYEIIVNQQNSYGCEMQDTLLFDVDEPPTALAGPDTVVCYLDTFQIEGSGSLFYNWSPSANVVHADSSTTGAFITESQWFYLTVTDQNGCADSDSLFAEVVPLPELSISPDTIICLGDSINLFVDGGVQYNWLTDSSTSTVEDFNQLLVYPYQEEEFLVEGFNSFGCRNTISAVVDVIYPLNSNGPFTFELCYEDSLIIRAEGGEGYNWYPDFAVTPNTGDEVLFEAFFDQQIIVEKYNECFSAYDTFNLIVHDPPELWTDEEELTFFMGQGLDIEVFTSDEGDLQWQPESIFDCADCFLTTAFPDSSMWVTANLISMNGCLSSVDIRLDMIDECTSFVYIPNTFTPNGDGFNDVLYVRTLYPIELKYFRVFDRWGNLVFETNSVDRGWDGDIAGGEYAQLGVYAFVVAYRCPINNSIIELFGNTTLIR